MRYSLWGLVLLLSTSCFAQSWDLRGDHHFIEVPNNREVVLYNGVACYRDTFEPVEVVKKTPEPVVKKVDKPIEPVKPAVYTVSCNGKNFQVPNGKVLIVLDGVLVDNETNKPFEEKVEQVVVKKPIVEKRAKLLDAFDNDEMTPTPVPVKREIVIDDDIPVFRTIELNTLKPDIKKPATVQDKPRPPPDTPRPLPDTRPEVTVSGKLIYAADKQRYAISDGHFITCWITKNAPDMKAQVDTQVTIRGRKVEDWNGASCLEPTGVPIGAAKPAYNTGYNSNASNSVPVIVMTEPVYNAGYTRAYDSNAPNNAMNCAPSVKCKAAG